MAKTYRKKMQEGGDADALSSFNPPTELIDKVSEQAGLGEEPATLPTGTEIEPVTMTVGTDEIVGDMPELETKDIETKTASEKGLTVEAPIKTAVPTAETALVSPDIAELGLEAARGEVSPEAVIGDIQGEVSANAIAKAATQELDERATTQYQLSELTKSLNTGGPLPAWAAPTARAVNNIMQNRGLGKSSVAAAAMTQALIESAVPIASQDANKYATIQLQNLNNEQQAALQNAATFAAMDTANLNARMTAAVPV